MRAVGDTVLIVDRRDLSRDGLAVRIVGGWLGAPGLIALRNTLDSPRRLAATMFGIGFAVFLTISQVGLLIGFVEAAQSVIRAAQAPIWVIPSGVAALEYPARMERRLADRILGQVGVLAVEPLVLTWAEWHSGNTRRGVALIGGQSDGYTKLPIPTRGVNRSWETPFAVHAPSGRRLGLQHLGDRVEINGHAAEATEFLDRFASFLGGPYVFVDVRDAQRMMGVPAELTNFLLVFPDPHTDESDLIASIQRLLPDQDVLLGEEFAARSSMFWLTQTGAGGGFLLTAVLGFVVGVVVVSQTLYTSVVNRQREYAALAAIGADSTDLRRVVKNEALMCGGIGGLFGLLLSYPGIWAMKELLVPWIFVPLWLRLGSLIVAVVMATLAATAAVRMVARQDPAAILRS